VINVYLSGNPVHDRVLIAFYDGCPEEKKLLSLGNYEPSDVAVVFGVFKSKVPVSFARGAVFRQQRVKNLDVIVLETGYINRGDGPNHHYAAGFNGLNGRADFRNKGMSPDRLGLLNVNLKPWRKDGKHILLCGQVPWDASVEMCHDYVGWLRYMVGQIRYHTKREIRFRPHPLGMIDPIPGTTYSTVPIAEDFKDCWAVVTFNSNSAVEGVIEGIPSFSFDAGSMATDVSSRWLQEIETWLTPSGRRRKWRKARPGSIYSWTGSTGDPAGSTGSFRERT
jgi:hypothetical protein